MSKQTMIDSLEKNIKLSQEFIELAQALNRLESNKDFIKLIKVGYFEKEAVRLVHLKSDPAVQRPESQQAIVGQIDGIGHLSAYFQTVKAMADRAAHAIDADRATIDELQAEEA